MDEGMQYTTVGHRGMAICSPIGSDQLDAVVEPLAPTLARNGSAIDIGCGKGELLTRLAERSRCAGIGIDPSPQFIAEARAAAEKRVPGLIRFVEGKAPSHASGSGCRTKTRRTASTLANGSGQGASRSGLPPWEIHNGLSRWSSNLATCQS